MIIVLAMGLILALAGYAIDVSQWDAKRHQAQVTADATALAAANCLASLTCTSTTAGGDAEQAGDKIAAANGYPKSAVTIGFPTSSTVTVKVKGMASSAFAGLFGFATAAVSGNAVASYSTGQGQRWSCSTNCLSLFAGNQDCPPYGTKNVGLSIVTNDSGGAQENITGLYTNGYYYNGAASNSTYDATEVNSGCGADYEKKPDHTTFTTVPSPLPYPAVWKLPTCTNTATAWTTAKISGGGVYCVSSPPAAGTCDSGAGTYTGAGSISVDLSALPAGAYEFVGPCVNLTGTQAAGVTNISGQPLVYGTSNITTYATSGAMPTCTVNDGSNGGSTWLTGNNVTLDGMVYDQCGTFEAVKNSATIDGFIEAWNIVTEKNGSVVGTGPSSPSDPHVTPLPGSDTLTQ